MKKFLPILKKCPLFEHIEEDNLVRMLTCLGAKTIEFDRKYTILSEGSKAKHIGIVLTGSVSVVQNDFYGNRSILSSIGPSEMFAEAFACAEVDAIPVSVIANETSAVMLIDCSHILHTCSNNCGFHQQLIYNLMKDLAKKTLVYHEKIDITSRRTTKDKLLAYLALQAKKNGRNDFDITFDRQELADYLEVDRSGLSAEISKLKNEGIIDCRKNHFSIQ